MERQMFEIPYIKTVLRSLKMYGYDELAAKEVLLRYYRGVKRAWGFGPNAHDFAREIHEIAVAVNRKFNPDDPDQIYIGHLKERIKKRSKDPKS